MKRDSSLQLTPAAALVELQADRPELHSITWTIGDQPGVLSGHHIGETGRGELVDVVADVTGGTVAHSSVNRDGDRQGVAQIVSAYKGVPVQVWASYPLPDAHGLTSVDYRELFAGRQLGALVCLPGGAA